MSSQSATTTKKGDAMNVKEVRCNEDLGYVGICHKVVTENFQVDIDNLDIYQAISMRLSILMLEQAIVAKESYTDIELAMGFLVAIPLVLETDLDEISELIAVLIDGDEEDRADVFEWFIDRTKEHPTFHAAEMYCDLYCNEEDADE